MKKTVFALIMIIIMCVCASSCNMMSMNGNHLTLKKSIELDSTGVIEGNILNELHEKNSVVTLIGYSDDIKYEWTIFGSELPNKNDDVNFTVNCEYDKKQKSVKVEFSSNEFSFSPLLSIYLNDTWNALSATAYDDNNNVICGVSVTSSDNTILNLPITKVCNMTLRGNELDEEKKATPKETHKVSSTGDPYLSNSQTSTPTETVTVNPTAKTTNKPTPKPTQDKYLTDPIPSGKPKPVEPEDIDIDKRKTYTCTFSIECSTILNNLSNLNPEKLEQVPPNGVIFKEQKVKFYDGESVFDVLKRVCKENDIHMEASWTPMYNSAYVEGIHNLYEFDCGELSGWMYRVNGWYPNYGASRYSLKDGDVVEWRYTCDLGRDVGCDWDLNG